MRHPFCFTSHTLHPFSDTFFNTYRSELSFPSRPPLQHASATSPNPVERAYDSPQLHGSLDDPDSYKSARRSRSMPLGFTLPPTIPKPGKLVKKPTRSNSLRSRERGSEARPKHKGPPPLYKEALRHPGLLVSAQPNVTRALRYAYDSPESDLSEEEGERREQVPNRDDRTSAGVEMGVLVYEAQSVAVGVSGTSTASQGMHPIKRDPAAVLQRSASFSQPTRHAYPHLIHRAIQEQTTNLTSPIPSRPSATPVHSQQRSVTSPSVLPAPSHPIPFPTPSRHRSTRSYSPSRTPSQRSPARTPPLSPPPMPLLNHPYNTSTHTLRASDSTLRASSSMSRISSAKHRDRPYDPKDKGKKHYVAGVCLDDFPAPPTHLPEPASSSHVRGYPNAMYSQATVTQRSQTTLAPLPAGARPSAFVQKREDPWLARAPRYYGARPSFG